MLALKAIAERLQYSRSIDRFIDENSHLPSLAKIGKMLIVHQILQAEKTSTLYRTATSWRSPDQRNDLLRNAWYDEFAYFWLTGIRRGDVKEKASENLRIVCFNYDRCLELYLCVYLAARYDFPIETAVEIVENLGIVHPYGSIGVLPDFRRGSEQPCVEFGDHLSVSWEAANALRTFTEAANSDIQKSIQGAMRWAERVIYLGFSFEPSNVNLLSIEPASNAPKSMFASTFGMEEPQRQMVVQRILHASGQYNAAAVQTGKFTCKEFVGLYGPTWD